MLKQGGATRSARRREVNDVHHRVGEHLTAGVVRAVDPVGHDLAEVAELDAVPDSLRAVTVGRVADAVGLDELDLRFVPGVADLGDEHVAVSDKRAHGDALALVERQAVRDVDSLTLLGEVFFVGASGLRGAGVGLRLDAVARRVEHHVIQDGVVETVVPFGMAALLHHDVPIAG